MPGIPGFPDPGSGVVVLKTLPERSAESPPQAKKINIFAPQGRLIAPIHLKFGMAEETRDSGSAWPCKISRQSVHGVGTRFPKIRKFQLFGRVAPGQTRSQDCRSEVRGGRQVERPLPSLPLPSKCNTSIFARNEIINKRLQKN